MDLNLAKVPFGKWMNKRAKRSSIASRQHWKLKNCFRAHFWSINCEYEVINSCETHCGIATVSTTSNKFPIFQIRDIYLPFHWPFVIINNAKTQPKAVNCKVRKDQKKISPNWDCKVPEALCCVWGWAGAGAEGLSTLQPLIITHFLYFPAKDTGSQLWYRLCFALCYEGGLEGPG